MKRMFGFVRHLHREAAWEAARNVFAVLGVGATLANIATMHIWMMTPAVALVLMTWFGFYKLYDVPAKPEQGKPETGNSSFVPDAANRVPEIPPRPVQAHASYDPMQSYRPVFASVSAPAKSDYRGVR